MERKKMLNAVREMARKGNRPSQILREIIHWFSPGQLHKLDLIRDMREAFALTLQQAKPIAGWSADGRGELTDNQLDDFLTIEILKNRSDWEKKDFQEIG